MNYISYLKKNIFILIGLTACTSLPSDPAITDQEASGFEITDNGIASSNTIPSENTSIHRTTDTLLIIVDNSRSINEEYKGSIEPVSATPPITKFSLEKKLIQHINAILPTNNSLNLGLRNFGFGPCLGWKNTRLLHPIQRYSPESLSLSIDKLRCASGGTPAHQALKLALSDLGTNDDNKAILFISDGNFTQSNVIQEIRRLKTEYDNKICIYPIWVGTSSDTKGYLNLQAISAQSCCGFTVSAEELQDSTDLRTYLYRVLNDFGSPMDTDCDGVADSSPDQCPNTPSDITVDISGCPLDDDKDGVFNDRDQCPNTPHTAPVDKVGCWRIPKILFETDKSDIKEQYKKTLDDIIRVMKNNPTLSLIIEGNTDNIGGFDYNMALSKKRADAAKRYIVKNGISRIRIKTRAYSFSKPIRKNISPENRHQNRRDELKIIYQPVIPLNAN